MSTNNLNVGGVAFDLPKNKSNIIKVIGIGGGGGNAVNHMHNEGIKGVDYVICNTDAQALENSPVANKVQLGVSLTEGMGAGADPEVGEKAAQESLEEIRKVLETNTKMVFITAGMGGGTGTGAAPVVAQLAKDMGILTVGIVTSPFIYEGRKRSEQAQAGIEKMRKCVDSLIVINNNKLSEIYGDLGVKESYAKADEILLKGAKGMAEVISRHYIMNIDLRDARTVLEDGGTAIMGSAVAEGENRAFEAVSSALNSPLLNDNRIIGAKNALLLIVYGTKEALQREIEEINSYIQSQAGDNMTDIIMGIGEDETLGESLSVTVIATGFDADQQGKIVDADRKVIIHTLEEEQTASQELPLSPFESPIVKLPFEPTQPSVQEPIVPAQAKPSRPEIFDILVDCEVVQAGDTSFIIVDKPKSEPTIQKPKAVRQTPPVAEPSVAQKTLFAMPPAPEKPKEIEPESEEPKMIIYNLDIDVEEKPIQKPELKPSINEQGDIVHSLEEYMELEDSLTKHTKETSSGQVAESKNEEISVSKVKIKQPSKTDDAIQTSIFSEEESPIEINPMNNSISEVMTNRARPETLRRYNHTFGNKDNEERQPSRTALGKDSLGDSQIRTNNSFLHDNVD